MRMGGYYNEVCSSLEAEYGLSYIKVMNAIKTASLVCFLSLIVLNIAYRLVWPVYVDVPEGIMGPVGIYAWLHSLDLVTKIGIQLVLATFLVGGLVALVSYLVTLGLRIKNKVWDWQFLGLTVFVLLTLFL